MTAYSYALVGFFLTDCQRFTPPIVGGFQKTTPKT